MTRLKQLLLLAALATSTRATWPRLDEALKNYPSIHARETANLKAGDATAKFVLEKKNAWAGWRLSHGSEWQVQDADLEEGPWNASVVVRTDHHFLHGVLCNAQIQSKKLFPPDDALYVQRILDDVEN